MEIPFSYQGYEGRVVVSVEKTLQPALLGARDGSMDLANCTATMR